MKFNLSLAKASKIKGLVRKDLIQKMKSSSRGFTLIESLAVIAIIGILLTLGTYLYNQAAAQARDAGRKSDLNQIAEAFNARYVDKTCADQAAINFYPGESLEQTSGNNAWIKVGTLVAAPQDQAPYDCGPFSKYLPTAPNDSRPDFSYYFNLSTFEKSGTQTVATVAKHYRLAAALEHQFAAGSPDQNECIRLSHVWINSFGGRAYDCDQHTIVLGKKIPLLVSATMKIAEGVTPICVPGQPCDGGGTGGGGDPGGGGTPPGGGTTQQGPYNYYIGQ